MKLPEFCAVSAVLLPSETMRAPVALALVLLWSAPLRAEPVVVLDPGHGGTNDGAFSPALKRFEKSLNLEMALRVERFLRQWHPDLTVVLTRTRDRYLTLAQRVRKANSLQGTLFVSFHFNASVTHAERGYETYILTREASAQEAARLALQDRERSPSTGQQAVIRGILSDLRQTAAHGESALLARRIQTRLARVRGTTLDRGVRQAPFDVLLGLRMPGVLVELGFIDHPTESLELGREATREALAVAVAAALSEHLLSARTSAARREDSAELAARRATVR
jgi:N-acetylmuramoyl-L-alanine amidase